MKGVLKFKGSLRFDGAFEGEIQSHDTLIVGAPGKIKARISTGALYNFGNITGDVTATDKIFLHADSYLEGNIKAPSLVTEDHAFFQGSCAMPPAPAVPAMKKRREIAEKASPPLVEDYDEQPVGEFNIRQWGHDLVAGAGGGARRWGRDLAAGAGGVNIRKWGFGVIAVLAVLTAGITLKDENALTTRIVTPAPDNEQAAPETIETAVKKNSDNAVPAKPVDAEQKDVTEKKPVDTRSKTKTDNTPDSVKPVKPPKPAIPAMAKNVEPDNGAAENHVDKKPADSAENKPDARVQLARQQAKLKMANHLIEQGEYTRAIDLMQKAVREFPLNVEIRALLARSLQKTGREKEAFEHFKKLEKLDPDNPAGRTNSAFGLLDKGLLDDAATDFRKILDDDQDNHRARLGLATVYSKLEENDKAAQECRNILDKEPGYAPAMNRLAWVLAKQNIELDTAESLSRKSLSVFPNIPEYLDTLSEINFRENLYDEAIRLIQQAVKLAPSEPYYKRQLFRFQRALKQAG